MLLSWRIENYFVALTVDSGEVTVQWYCVMADTNTPQALMQQQKQRFNRRIQNHAVM